MRMSKFSPESIIQKESPNRRGALRATSATSATLLGSRKQTKANRPWACNDATIRFVITAAPAPSAHSTPSIVMSSLRSTDLSFVRMPKFITSPGACSHVFGNSFSPVPIAWLVRLMT
jgi:hypothetical protein